MKVGDVVVRSYAMPDLIPGIIVEEEYEDIKPEPQDHGVEYTQHNFIVVWSDGSTSREMDVELDFLDEVLR